MPRDAGTRQNTWVIRLVVNGKNYGIWDAKSGGEIDSNELKYPPGGMQPPISLGGDKLVGNVVVSRIYDRVDDGSKLNELMAAAGRGRTTLTQRAMDPDGNEFGQSITYVGTLKRVSPPDTDSKSNDEARIECEITVEGYPAAV